MHKTIVSIYYAVIDSSFRKISIWMLAHTHVQKNSFLMLNWWQIFLKHCSLRSWEWEHWRGTFLTVARSHCALLSCYDVARISFLFSLPTTSWCNSFVICLTLLLMINAAESPEYVTFVIKIYNYRLSSVVLIYLIPELLYFFLIFKIFQNKKYTWDWRYIDFSRYVLHLTRQNSF